MDKIDIHHSEEDYKLALENLKKDVSGRNYKLIKDFLDASSIGMTARKNARKKQAGVRTRLKNIFLLKVAAKFMKKDLDRINMDDMNKFIHSLNDNKIKKVNGASYSEQTKSNMKIALILFIRYTIKNPSKVALLTDWIETSYKKKEITALSEDDIKKLLDKCFNIRQKTLVAVLFDSGARIEEFLNIRFGDITFVDGAVPYYRIQIKNEFSKTQGRHIALLWKPTTEILRQYLDENPKKSNLEAPFFPLTYDFVRKVLYKLGQKALGYSINPHLFRHSSATYYAGQGYDYFQLCKRYGWSIGSNMPHNYIDKSGIKDREMVDKFINSNIKDINLKMEAAEKERINEKEKVNSRLDEIEEQLKRFLGDFKE